MIKLLDLLKEIIDIYKPDQLKDKGIEYEIEEDSARRFIVNFKYKDDYYSLRILHVDNPKIPSINFGNTNGKYQNLNLNKLLNSPHSPRILAAIFGLIRFWIDKYNIQVFKYDAEGKTRNQIYDYYLKKHFSEFEKTTEEKGPITSTIWKRI